MPSEVCWGQGIAWPPTKARKLSGASESARQQLGRAVAGPANCPERGDLGSSTRPALNTSMTSPSDRSVTESSPSDGNALDIGRQAGPEADDENAARFGTSGAPGAGHAARCSATTVLPVPGPPVISVTPARCANGFVLMSLDGRDDVAHLSPRASSEGGHQGPGPVISRSRRAAGTRWSSSTPMTVAAELRSTRRRITRAAVGPGSPDRKPKPLERASR